MKILFLLWALSSLPLLAQDQEGDLQLPVTDLSTIQKQEEELPPTIEEVPMYEKNKRPEKIDDERLNDKKEKSLL